MSGLVLALPSWGWGWPSPLLGRGWQQGLALLGVRVRPSFSGLGSALRVGLALPFLGLGLALCGGVGPSFLGLVLPVGLALPCLGLALPSLGWALAHLGRGWLFCLGLWVGQLSVVIIFITNKNIYTYIMMVEEKRRQGLTLRVGVGPSFSGWGLPSASLGRGWPQGLALLGVRVGTSLSWVGVGTSFSSVGVRPSFSWAGVGPSFSGWVLALPGWPFLLGVGVGPSFSG